jgi:HPt (histidine-containing phosphotransfer) domain-containing protein
MNGSRNGLARGASSGRASGKVLVSGNGHGAGKMLASGNGYGAGNGHSGNGHSAGIGHGAATRPGDVARELISALWERSVPLISERLHGLDIACEAAVVGRLSPIMRRGAMDTAHKLAGSLGMFGYPRGTELAREIEQMLEYDGVVDPGLLRELVVELRSCLPL